MISERAEAQAPIVIPIRKFTLQNVTRRAAALSIGTPPQDIGFEVVPYVNNFYTYGTGICCRDGTTEGFCIASQMGIYDYNASTTVQFSFPGWFAPNKVNSSGFLSGAAPNLISDVLVSDVIHINQNTSLFDFPIYVGGAVTTGRSILGVGSNSTILSYLEKSNKIKSKVWSYFEGLYGTSEAEHMDGHVVLGGYDAAKTSGRPVTFNKSTSHEGCLTNLTISVSEVLIDIAGVSINLLGAIPSPGILMCIDPSYNPISLPLQVWSNFKQLVGGTEVSVLSQGIVPGGGFFAADSMMFSGNLTFRLESGLNLSIPNHQLIQPHRFIDHDGTLTVNETAKEVMIIQLEQDHAYDMPLLGHPFLSAAYLMVNNDNDTFTLWQSSSTLESRLVMVEPSCRNSSSSATPSNATSDFSSSPSISTPTATSDPPALPTRTTPAPPSSTSSKLSATTIAGVSLGAIAVAAILAGAIIWFILPRARRSCSEISHRSQNLYTKPEMPDTPTVPRTQELRGTNTNPARVYSSCRRQFSDIVGGELPADPISSPISDLGEFR